MTSMKFAKIIRTVTVAPIMALLTLSLLYLRQPAIFGGLVNYCFSLVFLTVLPLLGYPLQPVLPHFRQQGREGQRNLAIVMAVVGYIASVVYGLVAKIPTTLWVIYLTYFISGVGIVVFNKLLKIRASGHACGIAGPIAILVYYFGVVALLGLLLLALVFYTSIKMKRHTFSQLVWGSLISLGALLLSVLCLGQPVPAT